MLGILASIIDGVLVGLVYGLAAMGLTLIWGVMDVINLTHGAMIVAGMMALYLLANALGISPYLTLPSAAFLSAWRSIGSPFTAWSAGRR
jgi:branched-chain amino acid transport system permease protein